MLSDEAAETAGIDSNKPAIYIVASMTIRLGIAPIV